MTAGALIERILDGRTDRAWDIAQYEASRSF